MLNVFFHDGNISAVFYGNIFFLFMLAIKLLKNHLNELSEKRGVRVKNKAIQRAVFRVMGTLLFFCPVVLLLNCKPQSTDETAKSGSLSVAVDRHLEGIAGNQAESFSLSYPGATVKLLPDASGKSLKHLLEGRVKAALISGEPEAAEDSLFAQLKRPLRREPVARDAIVCIVNSRNPVTTLSTNELGDLLSAKEEGRAVPLVRADDFRMLSLLATATGKKRGELRPWSCSSDAELIARVSTGRRAVGLLFRSSLDRSLVIAPGERKSENRFRIVPIAKGSEPPCLPTQQNIFDGSYPLGTLVYYLYYPGDALAAGFGSWLSSGAGQKAFERSSLAPYRLVERTIILK